MIIWPAGGKCSQDADTSAVVRQSTIAVDDKLPVMLVRRVVRADEEDPVPELLKLAMDALLLYIAAFGIDEGESLGALLSQGPVTPALAHLFTDKQGFGWLSEDDFVHHFAADVDPVKAKAMYAVQQALAGSAFTDVMGVPAWKSLPSWYLVATEDQAIPPDAERLFASRMGATTVEVPSSHVAMVSHPDEVTQLIETAAAAVSAAG
jgi:pimeloyl-ACP methyl ester carboxylesterase